MKNTELLFYASSLFLLLLLTLMLVAFPSTSVAQNGNGQNIPIFLDCPSGCYQDYLRSNITFVNFARDQNDAQIHLLVTWNQTGSGGRQYTLNFMGRQNFASLNDTLNYISAQSDTDEERRGGIERYVRIGLARYVARTPMIRYAEFFMEDQDEDDAEAEQQDDPWNSWVFDIALSGFMNVEENRGSYRFGAGFDASRVTEEWKIELETQYDYSENIFELSDGREVTSTTSNQYFDGLVVRSINDHWSLGLTSRVGSSSFRNLDFEIYASPALEYNLFPYSEYNEHELFFRYEISPTYYKYTETTIFGQDEEFLLQHRLRVALNVTRTWGRINASLVGSTYIHDPSKNRLQFGTFMSLRLFRGLSLSLNGGYTVINDQLTLPAADITDEEALLRQRQQATSFDLYLSLGINYTFGSIFNNIVNPRF